jgi:DNA-binding SARP family transcriptional activator
MTEDLPLTLDDYRSLATVLEGQLGEPDGLSPSELDDLRVRLIRIHRMLGDTARAAEIALARGQREDDAEAFELTSTPRPVEAVERRESAMEEIEPLVSKDPADDPLRARYIDAATAEGGQLRAAGALARVAGAASDSGGRERIWLDVGTLYLQEGELPQARVAFLQAVLGGAKGPAALSAARRLLDLQVEPSDPEVVGPALDVVVAADPEPAGRQDAAMRLLELHATAPQKDERLVAAFQALIGSPKTEEAVAWLVSIRKKDPEAHLNLVAWLEQTGQWEPLCRVLEVALDQGPPNDRADRYARLGQIRLIHCHDEPGALAAFRRALEADPSSPECNHRLDGLLAKRESPEKRLARYEAALARASIADRRRSLMKTIAAIRRDALDDLPGAMETWQKILAEQPSDLETIDALLEGSPKVGGPAAALDAVARATRSLAGRERHEVALRTARALSRHGNRGAAIDLCRELCDDPTVMPAVVQSIAELAHDEDDSDLYQRALEILVRTGSPDTKKRALERLGDFQFEQLGDARAAAESWRPAARLCEGSPAEQEHARTLYERVLEALPEDDDAARRLADMYAAARDWVKLPDVLRVLFRSAGEREPGKERTVALLLDLEKNATEAGAADEFAALVDEVIEQGITSPEAIRSLKRARVRVLSSDAARQEDASAGYRELVESSALDEDLRAFETFIESKSSSEDRHHDRRWLYAWRAGREARPSKVLLDWAKTEEEFGATDAAITVYQRLADLEPGRKDALEALCRLKLHAGDFEGGLTALRSLRDAGNESERRLVILRMARVLLEELGRPAEAAIALAPLFGAVPPIEAAHQMMKRTLADAAGRGAIVERLEQLATEAGKATSLRVYAFLVDARAETATMPEARRRWRQRLVEMTEDPALALAAAADGVTEVPDSLPLWESAERLARETGQMEVVSRAYHRVLVDGTIDDPELAEALARRMVAFESEAGSESSRLVEALVKTLDRVPGARWAIDRVKLVLGSEARWDELFHLYDRAIEAAPDDRQRADLLDEAAFAAKDLAGKPERAIVYLEAIHDLRPDDVAVDAALERLYERQGRRAALIELLDARLPHSVGFKHRELLHRIASLWLDLGKADRAIAILEQMLRDAVSVAEVTQLLERVAADPTPAPDGAEPTSAEALATAQKRAISLLKAHYESNGQANDVVRMAERQLALAGDADQRARCVRDLVSLRLAAAAQTPVGGVFERVLPRVEADVAGDPALARIAFEALLQHAIAAWKQPSSTSNEDAQDGAWQAVHLLKALLLDDRKGEAALTLLYRCSRLPFERARRRELLREAAFVCSEPLADRARAIRVFEELFEEDGSDEAASRSLERFAELLDQSAEHARLAALWEDQGRIHAKAGQAGEQRACWERAASLWERRGEWERAIAGYREASTLASQAAFEALARIHSARGEWADAAGALEWLIAHAPEGTRGLRSLQLAEANLELGDRVQARACLERALAAGVEAERADQVPTRLIALYREDALFRPLAGLLAGEAKRITDPERRLALLREAAELHRRKLAEPEEAAALLELAVSLVPQDGTLRLELAEALEALGRWDRVVAVLRDQIAWYRELRSKGRALTHHQLARALTRAGHPEKSLAELRIAIEMHPAHPAILYDLGRSALKAGELELAESTHRALLLALHHAMEDAGDDPNLRTPDRAEVFIELSEVASLRDDAARAADLVDSAVDASLESAEDPERIEGPLRERGRHELVARAIERRVERAGTLASRAAALAQLAEVWAERLGRSPEMAARIAQHVERISRQLEHEGLTDAGAWSALSSVHRQLGDESGELAMAQRRIALLESTIPNMKPGADRNRLRGELARTLLATGARTDEGLAMLAAVLEDDPTDQAAADLLADTLEHERRFDELVVALERRLRSTPADLEGPVVTELTWRLAHALEGAGRTPDARAAYESILVRVDAARLPALTDRLEALGSDRLADSLERWLVTAPAGAPDVAERLIELRDRAGDAQASRRALELGFAATPGNLSFLRRLIDAYRTAGEPRETLRVLDAAIAKGAGDPELLHLRSEARESLGDDDGALFDLEAASVADPRHVDALLELHERVLAKLAPSAADQALPPIANAYAIRVTDVLIHAGRLDRAEEEIERVLARSPTHDDGLERMASLAFARGNWARAAEAYRALWPTAELGDSATLLRVAVGLADACERAGHAEAARDPLELALSKVPGNVEVMRRLERVCEATGDFARLANLLLAQAEHLGTAAERASLLVRAGLLLLEDPGGASRALLAADLARAADGESLEAAILWAKAQTALGRSHRAIGELGEIVVRSRGKRSTAMARVHLEIGRAHLAVDEIVEGFEALKAGFNMDWRNAEIAMLLGLVAIDLDEEKLAERALSGLTAMPARREPLGEGADPTAQASAFFHLASMAYVKGDRSKARRLAGKAVGVEAGHVAARALLDQLEAPGGSSGNRGAPRAVTPSRS